MSKRQTLKKAANSKGDFFFALVSDGVTFEVWKLCKNYDSNVKGGTRQTWRYVEKNMSKEKAVKMFSNKTK